MPLFIPQGASSSPSSGGGGGSSIIWEELDQAPIQSYSSVTNEIGVKIWLFQNAVSNYLYTSIKVPNSYTAGGQIRLRSLWYSAGTTGNVLFTTVATLIRPAVDTITTTTNQYVSTNSAVTLSAGTVNEPQIVIFDLTNASGQINAISVSPNDLLLIKLFRNSDTSANDASLIGNASEVTFS